MADRARIAISLSPQVEMSDADADNVFAVHNGVGHTAGSTFNKSVEKWSINMAKNVSSVAIPLFGLSVTNTYDFIYLKNTGIDSSGDSQSYNISLSLNDKVDYDIFLSGGDSVAIPVKSVVEEKIYVVCSDVGGVICEVIGGYIP